MSYCINTFSKPEPATEAPIHIIQMVRGHTGLAPHATAYKRAYGSIHDWVDCVLENIDCDSFTVYVDGEPIIEG